MMKREIVKALAVKFGMDEPTAKRVVEFVFTQLTEAVESDRRALVSELGLVEKFRSSRKKITAKLKSKIGKEGVAEARRLQQQHTPGVIIYAAETYPTSFEKGGELFLGDF